MPNTAKDEPEHIGPEPETQPDVTVALSDWGSFRTLSHGMLDDMLDYVQKIRKRPVWQPVSRQVRAQLRGGVPAVPANLASVHEAFLRYILPFTIGNAQPGFMGWVQRGGMPVGMLAEMLGAGLNAKLGGRDRIPEVDRQVVRSAREIRLFPLSGSGVSPGQRKDRRRTPGVRHRRPI
jgi:aromatic-L-amino-acid decarboxylase